MIGGKTKVMWCPVSRVWSEDSGKHSCGVCWKGERERERERERIDITNYAVYNYITPKAAILLLSKENF